MIEILTRLNTKASAFPDNQTEYKSHKQTCPACKTMTRKEVKENGCPRCGGTRQLSDVGGQNQTRGKSDTLMTPAYIASLLAGLPRHKADAALVYVTEDNAAAGRLMEHMVSNVIAVASYDWKLDDERKSVRVAGLAATSVRELAMYPRKIDPKIAAAVVGVKRTQWRDLWEERHTIFVNRMIGWTDDADRHMLRMHYGPIEKSA